MASSILLNTFDVLEIYAQDQLSFSDLSHTFCTHMWGRVTIIWRLL